MIMESSEATELLEAASAGDEGAMSRLLPLVYEELHAAAARAMRGERAGHTLQTTALVHEAWLRLADQTRVQWRHRSQFLAVAARMMRRVLVDHARARSAAKRGGAEGARVPLDRLADQPLEQPSVDLEALDEALSRLGELDPDQARVVELRYFGGLSVEEVAKVMGTSPATVKREWATAKAWLHREISRV
jgi:RNA polymerase sigma factor (TIGR02999 family)